MSLESFKVFVRNKPILADYVRKGEASWQDFYNIFELYGENSSVWSKYLDNTNIVSLKELFNNIRSVDLNEVQNMISSLQKGVNYLEDIFKKDEKNLPDIKNVYEKRPLYKYFDD